MCEFSYALDRSAQRLVRLSCPYDRTRGSNSREQAKTNFKTNNFKILNPIMFATLDKDDSMILRKKDDFKIFHENLLIGDDQFTSLWLKDANNKTF